MRYILVDRISAYYIIILDRVPTNQDISDFMCDYDLTEDQIAVYELGLSTSGQTPCIMQVVLKNIA